MNSSTGFSSSSPTMISWNSKPRLRTRHYCRAINFSFIDKANYYKVLSLDSETAGMEEIKKAYRSMALRYHPDVCPPSRREECTRMFVELQRAYETLKHDIELRQPGGEDDGRCTRRTEFPKAVWEVQLCALRRRSDLREGRMK
ncbi:hypothetical protein Cni_G17434 [Canna indica]|uniref:J domain-containing protein n=1 Tax=Canna indica TaxID=4628 RepID=A0AAQ3KMP8_9LILI|nr:hypothetical protein Cni_G17434 [Canna indica]